MTAILKNVYINKSDEIIYKYNKIYHNYNKYITMYIEYGIEHNNKNPKFKVGDCWRISKYKSISAKGYTPNFS